MIRKWLAVAVSLKSRTPEGDDEEKKLIGKKMTVARFSLLDDMQINTTFKIKNES